MQETRCQKRKLGFLISSAVFIALALPHLDISSSSLYIGYGGLAVGFGVIAYILILNFLISNSPTKREMRRQWRKEAISWPSELSTNEELPTTLYFSVADLLCFSKEIKENLALAPYPLFVKAVKKENLVGARSLLKNPEIKMQINRVIPGQEGGGNHTVLLLALLNFMWFPSHQPDLKMIKMLLKEGANPYQLYTAYGHILKCFFPPCFERTNWKPLVGRKKKGDFFLPGEKLLHQAVDFVMDYPHSKFKKYDSLWTKKKIKAVLASKKQREDKGKSGNFPNLEDWDKDNNTALEHAVCVLKDFELAQAIIVAGIDESVLMALISRQAEPKLYKDELYRKMTESLVMKERKWRKDEELSLEARESLAKEDKALKDYQEMPTETRELLAREEKRLKKEFLEMCMDALQKESFKPSSGVFAVIIYAVLLGDGISLFEKEKKLTFILACIRKIPDIHTFIFFSSYGDHEEVSARSLESFGTFADYVVRLSRKQSKAEAMQVIEELAKRGFDFEGKNPRGETLYQVLKRTRLLKGPLKNLENFLRPLQETKDGSVKAVTFSEEHVVKKEIKEPKTSQTAGSFFYHASQSASLQKHRKRFSSLPGFFKVDKQMILYMAQFLSAKDCCTLSGAAVFFRLFEARTAPYNNLNMALHDIEKSKIEKSKQMAHFS